MDKALIFTSSLLLLFWGIAHLFPLRSIVKSFGKISKDHERILTMEWINEGVMILFIAAIIATLTALDYQSMISNAIYILCVIALNTLSVISLFTAFKVNYLPYRLCPIIFTGSSVLILLGILM